jgi:hypothetical protein
MTPEGREKFRKMMEGLDFSEDLGKQPAQAHMDETAQKLSALYLAINATLQQLIKEGVFDPKEIDHFLLHFSDFASRLFAGESVSVYKNKEDMVTSTGVKITNQSFSVNSRIGELYKNMAELVLVEGKIDKSFESMKTEDGSEIKVFNSEEEFKAYLANEGATTNDTAAEQVGRDFDLSEIDATQIHLPKAGKLN